jgi:hypothetical protein
MKGADARQFGSSALVALFALPASAASWVAVPAARLGGDYNDNVQLTSVNAVPTYGASADLGMPVVLTSEALEIRLVPRLVLARYQRLPAYNRHDQYVTLGLTRTAPATSTALELGWTNDSTLTSELGTTGLTQSNRRHHAMTATATQTWAPAERWSYALQLSGERDQYLQAAGTGLVDYNYLSGSVQSQYLLSTRAKIGLSLTSARLTIPDGTLPLRDNRYAEITLENHWNALWTSNLAAGPSQIRVRGSNDSGLVYSALLSRRGERSTLELSAKQDVTPNGFGLLVRRRELGTTFTWPLSERLRLTGAVRQVRSSQALERFNYTFGRIDFLNTEVTLGWDASPTTSLLIGGGHVQQRSAYTTAEAVGTHAYIGVRWSARDPRAQ